MELSVMKNYSQENFNRLSYDDSGPHREMAIDCPVNFVGIKKEPPKYPRPLSVIQSQTVSTSGLSAHERNKASNIEVSNKTSKDDETSQNRIKKYKEDLQKRKEQEEKIQREQDFLRTSLRDSKKLQELKEPQAKPTPTSTGFVNPNYISEEETAARRGRKNTECNHLEVQDIVASVKHVQKYLDNPEDRQELGVISQFVLNEKFQQLLKVHNKVVDVKLKGIEIPKNSLLAQEADNHVLQEISLSNHYAARELSHLLDQSAFKNIILAHDKIIKIGSQDSSKMSEAEEKEYLDKRATLYGESCIKIVRLNKSSEPLGATVKNEGESVVISRIVKGSMADQSGLLHEGDEILEINGNDVRGRTINDVFEFMSGLNGQLTFLVHPAGSYNPPKLMNHNGPVHLRALFNYDPKDDNYMPCRDMGFSFMKGDVLHVIDTRDDNWWQAYREGEEDHSLAGLIPSPSFQLKREELKQLILGDMKENRENQKKCYCVSRKKSDNLHQLSFDSDSKEFLTYEEVALYYPQPNRKRPIVLIGPQDVGRRELRLRLMKSDMERFGTVVPHTSRPPKHDEVNHKDYHFVSKQEFEKEMFEDRFVEHGIFEKHYFGTSLEAIREVVNTGRICILNLYPQALKILKASDLKPYFIFIAPPNIESLKQFKIKQGIKFTDETLKSIIEESREIEDQYGHYFDLVIIITDLNKAYDDLLYSINQLEVQPQWVPISWLT